MANQIVISRIQNRRGIRENLPQPLLPGEFALTVDQGELWIGTDPAQPPWGVRTYGTGGGDISNAETLVDTEIFAAKFIPDLDETTFLALRSYLIDSPQPEGLVLVDTDVLWDESSYVFIAADTSVDVNNTLANINDACAASPASGSFQEIGVAVGYDYGALGAINDPTLNPTGTSAFDGDGAFLFGSGNAEQGSNAARLINQIHGVELVTTLANLQVTTSGIGVGSSTFALQTVTPVDSGYSWAAGPVTVTADSVVDELTWVAGGGILLEADTTLDAIRITNTSETDFDILYAPFPALSEFTLTLSTAAMTDVTGLLFNMTESDVIFLDYSANIAGGVPGVNNYTVAGNMQIVGDQDAGVANAGIATLNDTQVEVRYPGLAGAIAFEAVFVAGTPDIQIQYTNTFTSNVTIRVVRRRWASY